jgi:3-phenylpropionate/trans-cinnamate dioxygenase ferredoxin subunit
VDFHEKIFYNGSQISKMDCTDFYLTNIGGPTWSRTPDNGTGIVMAKFVAVCELNALESGTMRNVQVGKKKIVVIRQGDELYALEDRCSHENYPLSDGFLEEGKIACAMHGAEFDLKTGEALALPAYENVNTYVVRVNDGMVEVQID